MSFSIVGAVGIDDCSAGEGSCAANCHNACNDNEAQMAYCHFTECGGINCYAQTGRPKASGGCGSLTVKVYQKTCSGVSITPALHDCGPASGQTTSSGYCISSTLDFVACVNSLTFAALCGACNPLNYGVLGAHVESA